MNVDFVLMFIFELMLFRNFFLLNSNIVILIQVLILIVNYLMQYLKSIFSEIVISYLYFLLFRAIVMHFYLYVIVHFK